MKPFGSSFTAILWAIQTAGLTALNFKINEGISQPERLAKLNAIAISQMKVLTEDHRLLQLEAADDTGKPE